MNPYQVLQVNKNATKEQIRKAYRTLARKYHPDANPNNKIAEEKFKEINDAYVILGDETKKREYDRKENKTQSMRTESSYGKKPADKSKQPQRATSARGKSDFKMDRESIHEQFSDFFGFKM